jgi:hypothetical protein
MAVQQLSALAKGSKGVAMAKTTVASVAKAQFIKEAGMGLGMGLGIGLWLSIGLVGVAGVGYWMWKRSEQPAPAKN